MGDPSFCNFKQKESDIRHNMQNHHFQHQRFADKEKTLLSRTHGRRFIVHTIPLIAERQAGKL